MSPARPFPLEERRAEIRTFLADVARAHDTRRLMETTAGYEPSVWCRMAETFGMQALLVPGECGGRGAGWPEMALVLEEMGRALVCAPFLSTAVLATAAVVQSDDEAAMRRWLPAMATGRLVATVALAAAGAGWDPEGASTTATRSAPGGWVLDGRTQYVLDGHIADLVVVPAHTPTGLTLFAVEGDAPGLVRTLSRTMDQTRKLATLELSAAPARRFGQPGAGGAVLRTVLDLASVALAAEAVGGAQRCLEMAVDHVNFRHQFGRPIGSFQAVKHRCADMLVAVEAARAAAAHAAQAAAETPSADLTVAASLAKVCCSEAFFRVAAETIQLHGAAGFSWDHDAHLYFKRATSSKLLFGDPAHHRRLLGDRLGL